MHFLPVNLLPTSDQARLVSRVKGVRTCDLLSPINKGLQHSRYSALGKGLADQGFLFRGSLRHSN